MTNLPTLDAIVAARTELDPHLIQTPIHRWRGSEIDSLLPDTEVNLKLELWQYTGTFKPRGAMLVMLGLDESTLADGVTAVSAGNHAIAVSFAAKRLNVSAKVVMPRTANPYRIERSRAYGAEVVLADDVDHAFALAHKIEENEGRYFVHPYEGPRTILGTATVGLEFCRQAPDMDAFIIPIGGGGLCAGMSSAIRQLAPAADIIGVEPVGAALMRKSLDAGKPIRLDSIDTIADSLAAPHATPGTFALLQENLTDLVLIRDAAIRSAMSLMFRELKFAVEPAAAAATAALLGPLKDRMRGRRVGVLVCGSNTDIPNFTRDAE